MYTIALLNCMPEQRGQRTARFATLLNPPQNTACTSCMTVSTDLAIRLVVDVDDGDSSDDNRRRRSSRVLS